MEGTREAEGRIHSGLYCHWEPVIGSGARKSLIAVLQVDKEVWKKGGGLGGTRGLLKGDKVSSREHSSRDERHRTAESK